MGKTFNSVEEMLLQLKKDVTSVVNKEVDNIVKDIYSNQVDYAYSEYEPRMYQRRYNNSGGFADEDMWKTEINVGNENIEYTMRNEAKARGLDYGEMLDDIFEEGRYQYSPSPEARPVYERTQDVIDGTSHVESELEDGLKKNGW